MYKVVFWRWVLTGKGYGRRVRVEGSISNGARPKGRGEMSKEYSKCSYAQCTLGIGDDVIV